MATQGTLWTHIIAPPYLTLPYVIRTVPDVPIPPIPILPGTLYQTSCEAAIWARASIWITYYVYDTSTGSTWGASLLLQATTSSHLWGRRINRLWLVRVQALRAS